MLPFVLDRDNHWLNCAEELEGVNGFAYAANLFWLAKLDSP